jgi:lipoate-protein ligase A
MRVVRPDPQSVPDALALSLRMLAEGDCPALVVHRVSPPAITCGRAQMTTVDTDAIAASGLALVPRGSGGGPVLWDDALIAIDVILPDGDLRLPTDIVAAYRWVGEAVVSALTDLGIPGARAVPPDEARAWPPSESSGLCFGGLSPWEVVVGHRKVLGLAQVRKQAGAIIQVGVPMRLNATRLAAAVGAPDGAADDLRARTAGVADLAPECTRDMASEALVHALSTPAAASGRL